MNWNDVLSFSNNNPHPGRRVEKTAAEWKEALTPEQYRITRKHGTEPAFSGTFCEAHAPGIYACICCGTALFDSTAKFNSRSGWPSFAMPVKEHVIRYSKDTSWGATRIEVLCAVCDAHLGHVFPDGPAPSGLRFCINSVSLKKLEDKQTTVSAVLDTATMGGGCFWCIEAVLDGLMGVKKAVSGYAGGTTPNPTYREVCNGNTGYAEVVQVTYDPAVISYADLLRIFLSMHNPTKLNRQGADTGSQYRSVIFYHNSQQEKTAGEVLAELAPFFEKKMVTEVSPYTSFFKAEEHHQQYYKKDPLKAYCQSVINPKLNKMRAHFNQMLKPGAL